MGLVGTASPSLAPSTSKSTHSVSVISDCQVFTYPFFPVVCLLRSEAVKHRTLPKTSFPSSGLQSRPSPSARILEVDPVPSGKRSMTPFPCSFVSVPRKSTE